MGRSRRASDPKCGHGAEASARPVERRECARSHRARNTKEPRGAKRVLPRVPPAPLAPAQEGKKHDAQVFGAGAVVLPTPNQEDGWLAGARRRASESDPTFPPTVTLHDLRHTAASLAISAGANIKAVQRSLGHASAAMTLGTYADLFDDDLEGVATVLDLAKSASLRAPGSR
jgi:integrase